MQTIIKTESVLVEQNLHGQNAMIFQVRVAG